MRPYRALKWAGAVLAGLVLLTLLVVGGLILLGGNWLREPASRAVYERTGRILSIDGDVRLGLGWPAVLRISAGDVSFSNPAWATQADKMLTADEVRLAVPLLDLLRRRPVIDELVLRRADVSFETDAQGRKNWLLDPEQKNEESRVVIGKTALIDSRIRYDERWRGTSVRAAVSSVAGTGSDLAFEANGQYLRMPFEAKGSGGALLRLRDESRPYPFRVKAAFGPTRIDAEGSVTGLSRLSAVDLKISAAGKSLDDLYPILGIALPRTPQYRTSGRLSRAGQSWRFEKFDTVVGGSDFTGTLQVDGGGKRPFLHGEVIFGKLNLADLGPVIGTAGGEDEAAAQRKRVLPDVPFDADRWTSVDANVRLSARSIVRPRELPLELFTTHLRLRDAVLSLDPLEFGIAGGRLASAVTLDGRQEPIRARVNVKVAKIALDRLFPGFSKEMVDPGRVDGQIELSGRGDSVGEMLGTANGTAALVVAGGHVSRLAMEMVGLHIPEIVALKAGGDEPVPIRCGAAEFEVKNGVMNSRMLVFDTSVTTIRGTGKIDLANERLNLTLLPRTKQTSLLSLRTPVHIRGFLGKPSVEPEAGPIAARGLGALALGVANPLLMLIPLIEQGPGKDSDCGRLFREAGMAGKAREAPKAK